MAATTTASESVLQPDGHGAGDVPNRDSAKLGVVEDVSFSPQRGGIVAPAARYDVACAYCANGVPVVRVRRKAVCERCWESLDEPIADDGQLRVSPDRLRALVRYVLGLGPRDYVRPLWERALKGRAG